MTFSSSFGSFTRRALLAFATLSLGSQMVAGDATDYAANAKCALTQLMTWYNQDAGLWTYPDGAVYWWQAANMLSATVKLSGMQDEINSAWSWVFDNTYNNAPASNIYGEEGFISDYYDDEGWWGLAWVDAYDLTQDSKYLDEAKTIFADMDLGWGNTSCGGIPWNKLEDGSVAIANEIYIQLAAELANRVGGNDSATYLDKAQTAWQWFNASGLINSDNLINDGLDLDTCENNGDITYTYNQGTIIGGLVELYKATSETSFLDVASSIADATTQAGGPLTTEDGVLIEYCDPDQSCAEGDETQFKGIFTRNLVKLWHERQQDSWKTFLQTSAQSIWNNDLEMDGDACVLGEYWIGPVVSTTFNASAESSGLDGINAALEVTG